MKRICVIILNYRRAPLTIDCVRSLADQVQGREDRHVVIVDAASGDDSVEVLQHAIVENGWDDWLTFIPSETNRGFAGGNNLGFQAVEAEAYLLLNSDARLTDTTIDDLLRSLDEHSDVGLIGPRLQYPDGEVQVSAFRFRTPMSELLQAAATGVIDRLFRRFVVAMGVFDEPTEAEWVSFACILIRRDVIEQIGLMDEKYFMYFEDIDYSRHARQAGWRVLHDPRAVAIHLRGGTSSVKGSFQARKRVPKYYYESRSRYFAKNYGGVPGLMLTNLMWVFGRSIAFCREIVGNKKPHACLGEFTDNWTNWLDPMRDPPPPGGGEL